ncbi:MAG: TolC family protein [Opitutus sp.]|nr:TolC family protein [Opitutus sp.]
MPPPERRPPRPTPPRKSINTEIVLRPVMRLQIPTSHGDATPPSRFVRKPLRFRPGELFQLVPFLISLAVVAAATSGATAAEPLALSQVMADVRANNPQLRSAAATAAADRERVNQSAAWEDPVAGVEIQRLTTNRINKYDAAEFSLSQKFPLSGNRERRRAVAAAEAGVSAATVRTRELMLVGEAREAFFQLLRAREQLALTRESDRLLAQATEIARSRLATGTGSVSGLFLAESERTRLQEKVIMLDREAADAAATLNTLRALPPQAPVAELAPPAPPGSTDAPTAFASLEDAQAHAFAHRPDLQEANARITVAQRMRELADRAWRPDPELMLKARHLSTGGRVIEGYDTGVAVSLPWFNDKKYRSAQREADRRREAAELDAGALRTKSAAEIRAMWQRIETARRNVELFRDRLLPLARQGADSVRQDLVTGKATIADLVTAQRTLIDAQTALAANLADFHRYHAMLHVLAGSPDPT